MGSQGNNEGVRGMSRSLEEVKGDGKEGDGEWASHCVYSGVAVVWPFSSGCMLLICKDSARTKSNRLECCDSMEKSVEVKGCECS